MVALLTKIVIARSKSTMNQIARSLYLCFQLELVVWVLTWQLLTWSFYLILTGILKWICKLWYFNSKRKVLNCYYAFMF